ncbi:hypothetical protein ACHWQZ_G003644 [Mnemiopsis leidyi]
MDRDLDQFTFNSRPAATTFSSKDQSRSERETYKYTVIICNNSSSVCQYCHIKIKQQDLMLMTKSQRNTNDAMKTPCFYGYHCDCFFLSSNVCKSTTELYGYSSLSKYHRHYIVRKIAKSQTKTPTVTKEVPGDLKVGYSILDRRLNYYCEQCNMAMLPTDIKIAGILKKYSDMVVYHPRCFSQIFERHPIKLQGLDKLLPHDISGLKSMLNIIDTSNNTYYRCNTPRSQLDSAMKFKTTTDAFLWPRDSSSSGYTWREHEQNRQNYSSSSSPADKIWNSKQSRQPSIHPSYADFRRRPTEFDELLQESLPGKSSVEKTGQQKSHNIQTGKQSHIGYQKSYNKPENQPYAEQQKYQNRQTDKNPYLEQQKSLQNQNLMPSSSSIGSKKRKARKRKKSFKPNTDNCATRNWSSSGARPTDQMGNVPNPQKKEDFRRSSSSDSNCDPGKMSHQNTEPTRQSHHSSECSQPPHQDSSDCSGKVELKKSTIRSEITSILYEYNHDYITSKKVRTMLMQKFGCDLTPHKKYIDDTIMELLDVIDNNPINLKSIPGRVFVEEGDIEYTPDTSDRNDDSHDSDSPVKSPMSANIDDISPFAIMSNQADKIALSNVDTSVCRTSSKSAWGDKSNSPMEKNKVSNSDDKGTSADKEMSKDGTLGKKYALKKDDKPINLCECCLCCFRIQTLEEIASLYEHVQTKHKKETRCVVCDIKFKDCYSLMLHVAEFHRGGKSFRCKNCCENFNYHSELAKHQDFCFLSSESDDLEDSPINSPQKKKQKFEKSRPVMPELVNTLKNTQDTLDKIKTLITSEASSYEGQDW